MTADSMFGQYLFNRMGGRFIGFPFDDMKHILQRKTV
jgi:hypothetical protein